MATAACHTDSVGRVRLRVIGGSVDIDDHVPATRAECKDGPRPCPHVRCEWHLWLERGEDGQGRRVNGRPPASTLRPVWLDWPLPPSCGADVADAMAERGEWMQIAELARLFDRKPTAIREVLARCGKKLRGMGLDLRSLMQETPE